LFSHGGKKILATHTASYMIGIDAKTGKMLWSRYQPNQHKVHANTPIYHDGGLFYFSGYGQGAGKVDLNEDGTKITSAWKKQEFDSRMGGAVLVDGYIYGSGDQYREWKCLDWETGDTTYTSTDISKGVVIYADGMLYCYSERGELALVKATPGKFDLISKTIVEKGSEQHWAHPMIHKGVLYLRHGNALIAYLIK
jgi:outer membrane protein assembly factor BamB